MTRTAILMRDDVALAAFCDDRLDLHGLLGKAGSGGNPHRRSTTTRRGVQTPAPVGPSPDTGARKSGTFSTLSTLLLWIVISAGYLLIASGAL